MPIQVIYNLTTQAMPGYESEFYEELSLYGQMPVKNLADVMPK